MSDITANHQVEKPVSEEIRDLLAAIWRNRRIAAVTLVLVMCGVIFYIWTTTPLYSSKVEILIDPRQRQTIDREVTPTGLGSSAAGADTLLLESQIEVLRSQQVMDALILAEGLTDDSEFAGSSSSGPIYWLKAVVKFVVYGPQQNLWQSMSAYDRARATLRERLDIDRQRNTYVIAVTMQSSDPKKASRLANRLADIYVANVNSAASSSTREVATILDSKLDTLRQSANRAAVAVEQYRRENGLIDANQTLIVEQQLSDLNRELTQAKSVLQSAAARRNQVKAAMETGGAGGLGLSEIAESPVMSQLQTRLAEIESREADLRSVYLDSHPTLGRLREQKAALKASMRREYARILKRLDVAYRTAEEKEATLRADVAELEAAMAVSNSSTVQLRELQREAASSRTVYENFLQRSKEAREQVDIPNSTARLISRAYAASKPGHPKVFMLLVGGLVAGAVLGVLVALLAHVFPDLFGLNNRSGFWNVRARLPKLSRPVVRRSGTEHTNMRQSGYQRRAVNKSLLDQWKRQSS